MPASELFQWRLDSAQKYDDSERSLGDVLDVKASVALVAVTFLAGVSAQLLTTQGLSPLWVRLQWVAQFIALACLSVAGAFIFRELWPSDYAAPPTPREDADWIAKLSVETTDPAAVLEKVLAYKLTKAIDRVDHNKQINDRKSNLLAKTFRFIAGAMVLILGNLMFLAVRALWPVLTSWFKCA